MHSPNAARQLIDSGYPIGTIETHSRERIEKIFKRHELTSDQAVYAWSSDRGLYRIGWEYIRIPKTERIETALDFIACTIHFGVYVFYGAGIELERPEIVERLRSFAQSQIRIRRMVIFVDENIPPIPSLRHMVMQLRHGVREAG
jgi:hypothetical protein